MTEARALWTVAPGRCELRRETLRPRGADEVLVRTLASGVSRGTERLVLHGRVPARMHDAMRAPFQAGDFSFPVKYGYSAVGVVDIPRCVRRIDVGTTKMMEAKSAGTTPMPNRMTNGIR